MDCRFAFLLVAFGPCWYKLYGSLSDDLLRSVRGWWRRPHAPIDKGLHARRPVCLFSASGAPMTTTRSTAADDGDKPASIISLSSGAGSDGYIGFAFLFLYQCGTHRKEEITPDPCCSPYQMNPGFLGVSFGGVCLSDWLSSCRQVVGYAHCA